MGVHRSRPSPGRAAPLARQAAAYGAIGGLSAGLALFIWFIGKIANKWPAVNR